MSQPEIYWVGESGKEYGYYVHPLGAQFRKVAGNVIFAKKDESGQWMPVYIGQTRDFDEGLAERQKELCARKHGATHVHVHHSSPGRDVREAEVADLIARWKPVCNR